jgi:hypothetical protein
MIGPPAAAHGHENAPGNAQPGREAKRQRPQRQRDRQPLADQVIDAVVAVFHTPIGLPPPRRVRARGLQGPKPRSCRPGPLTRRSACEICGLKHWLIKALEGGFGVRLKRGSRLFLVFRRCSRTSCLSQAAGQNPRFFLTDRPGFFPKQSSSLQSGLLSHPGAGGPPASSWRATDRRERKGYP